MEAEHIGGVAIVVILATQIAKFAGLPDRHGPVAVLAFAAVGVVLFRLSMGTPFVPADYWQVPVAWLTVAASASGVYGFSRAVYPADVTRTRKRETGGMAGVRGRF